MSLKYPAGVDAVSIEELTSMLLTHFVEAFIDQLVDKMELPTLNKKTLIVGERNITKERRERDPDALASQFTLTLQGTSATATVTSPLNPTQNGVVVLISNVLVGSEGGDGDDGGLDTIWIIVIVVGGVLALAALVVVGFFGYRYYQNRNGYIAIGGDDLA